MILKLTLEYNSSLLNVLCKSENKEGKLKINFFIT